MHYTPLSPDEIRTYVYEEAKRQFLKNGIANTEMKQIAQAVGIGRTTLYRYFPSKEQLAFMVSIELTRYLAGPDQLSPNLSGFEKLERCCECIIQNLLGNPEILFFFAEFDSMFSTTFPDIPEADEYGQHMFDNIALVTRYMIEGQQDGSVRPDEDPDAFIAILVNTIIGLLQRLPPRDPRYQDYIDEHGHSSAYLVRKAVQLLLSTIRA